MMSPNEHQDIYLTLSDSLMGILLMVSLNFNVFFLPKCNKRDWVLHKFIGAHPFCYFNKFMMALGLKRFQTVIAYQNTSIICK